MFYLYLFFVYLIRLLIFSYVNVDYFLEYLIKHVVTFGVRVRWYMPYTSLCNKFFFAKNGCYFYIKNKLVYKLITSRCNRKKPRKKHI